MYDLNTLATLVKEKNVVDGKIAEIIGRPTQLGHVGEYIAAAIFNIELHQSATQKGSDGYFMSGSLKGCTVNVKWYPKQESLLDLNLKHFPDYYLVLTGLKSPAISSRGTIRPWLIEHVFLFETQELFKALQLRGVQIGVAASVRMELWTRAEIYPVQRNNTLVLNDLQCKQLTLFR